jgi:tetratricopeptide (TPR) repeat protein
VGEIDTLEVPETLHALIAARLDGLAPEERRLLGDAAVLGKTFAPHALAALSGLESEMLEGLLTGLVRREVLGLQSDPRSPEQGQYTFLQDLLRHVAYETLPKRERRDKHLAAAEHLSASLGEDEVAEVIASHLVDAYRLDPDAPGAAPLRERAREGLFRAGERAQSLGAATEARRYFEQAAELSGEPADQANALFSAARVTLLTGAHEDARRLYEEAMLRYEETGDTHGAARCAAYLAHVERLMGRIEQAIERIERAYATVADDEPDADVALLLSRLGQQHLGVGNLDKADEWTERALDLGEALELPETLSRSWMAKAMILQPRRPREARALYALTLETALANENYSSASVAAGNLSNLAFFGDRYGESLGYLEQELELARRIGDRVNEWFGISESTYALTMLGRWDEALVRLAEIPDEQLGTEAQILSPLSGPLEIFIHRGQLDDARALLARFAEFRNSGDIQARGCCAAALAAVRLAEGNPREALPAAMEAFETRDAQGISSQNAKLGFLHAVEAALALEDRATVDTMLSIVDELPAGLRPPLLEAFAERFRAALAGDDPGADRLFTSAAVKLRQLELPFHLAVVQLEHGEWLTARGRPDDAQPLLGEARETFERLQAQPWLERIDAVSPGTPAEVLA